MNYNKKIQKSGIFSPVRKNILHPHDMQNNRFPYYASHYRTIFEPKVSEFLMENGYNVE